MESGFSLEFQSSKGQQTLKCDHGLLWRHKLLLLDTGYRTHNSLIPFYAFPHHFGIHLHLCLTFELPFFPFSLGLRPRIFQKKDDCKRLKLDSGTYYDMRAGCRLKLSTKPTNFQLLTPRRPKDKKRPTLKFFSIFPKKN